MSQTILIKGNESFSHNAFRPPDEEKSRNLGLLDDIRPRQSKFCEKSGTDEYTTVKVSFLQARVKEMRGATRGECDCKDVCNHSTCVKDYESSLQSGMLSCKCFGESESKPMCGNHTTCVDDVCACIDGFIGDPTFGCVAADACLQEPCGINAACTNGDGSRKCSCLPGFIGDATIACVDVDECTSEAAPCGKNAKCINTIGSYKCECMEGYVGDATISCHNINECDTDNICGENTSCIDSEGSFQCKCLEGFRGKPKIGCVDVNECKQENTCVGTNKFCKNLKGSYECHCKKGYEMNPKSGECMSISECWGDGVACEYGSSCNKCCNPATYWWKLNSYACSFSQPCWVDGDSCIPGVNCNLCCNGSFDDNGTKCGGQCWENEETCGVGTTCNLCCGDFYWKNTSSTACGEGECWEDGTECSPIQGSCNQCCNEAFTKNGTVCGGECWKKGKECDEDSTCHLCCSFSEFWPSKNTTACGFSPCLEDGVSCGEYCWNCCNGAYEDEGKTCGGNCWDDGEICDPLRTCNLCCDDVISYLPEEDVFTCGINNETCLEDGFDCGAFDICWQCCNVTYGNQTTCGGGECLANGTVCGTEWDSFSTCDFCCDGFYLNSSSWEFICGSEPCLEDGTACIPGVDCDDCCNGNFANGGYQCGGECLANGTLCEYGVTCQYCCEPKSYWFTKESYACGYEPCYDDGTSCDLFLNCSNCCDGVQFIEDLIVCGWEPCFEDGTSCIPGLNCEQCCNGAYLDNGTTCGGKCLRNGTECDYFSTCRLCCDYWDYDDEDKKYKCTSGFPDDDLF